MKYTKCAECGKLIKFDARKRSVYCSRACRQKAYRKRHRIERAKSDAAVKVHCLNCGTTIITRKRVQKFCCTSCRASFWQQQKRLEKGAKRV